jgi:hypothetical protein
MKNIIIKAIGMFFLIAISACSKDTSTPGDDSKKNSMAKEERDRKAICDAANGPSKAVLPMCQ